MFEAGGTVLYGTDGVCVIKDIVDKNFGETIRQYYVLEPLYLKNSTIYVPIDNEKLSSKMRQVVSKDEIDEIITGVSQMPSDWIEDEASRKEKYKEVIARGDCRELVQMARTLYLHREKVTESGRKFYVADDRFLKTAEKMIFDEFATVLEIEPEEVPFFIERKTVKSKIL